MKKINWKKIALRLARAINRGRYTCSGVSDSAEFLAYKLTHKGGRA
jgi:hypothetical protein